MPGRVALLLLSSLLCAALLEVGARVWVERFATPDQFRTFASLDQLRARRQGPSRPFSRYVPHRLVGYVPSPNFRSGDDEHDSRGYRGSELPRVKPRDEFRIVCLGGSTTYTTGVEDARAAYPAQLQKALHRRGRTNVRVVNAGAAGYSSWESLANLQFRVLDLDPDMIIVYHAINDVINRFVWPPKQYIGDGSGWLGHMAGFDTGVPLLERSTALRILLIRLGRAQSHLALDRVFGATADSSVWWFYVAQIMTNTYPDGLFRNVSADAILAKNRPVFFERNLESMIAIARAHGIQPVLATFAQSREGIADALNSPPVAAGIDEHNRIVREIGGRRDVPVFDFAADFPNRPGLYVDSVHLTERGAAVKARLFAGFLLENALVPRP